MSAKDLKFTFQRLIKKVFIGDYAQIFAQFICSNSNVDLYIAMSI
jgi:hypothetical protein